MPPGDILVGTSGYSFPDWVGPFYPPGMKSGDFLHFYSERFRVAHAPRYKSPRERRLIFTHIDEPGYTNDLECYRRNGGYEVMKKAFARKPEELIEALWGSEPPETDGCSRPRRPFAPKNQRRLFRPAGGQVVVVCQLPSPRV